MNKSGQSRMSNGWKLAFTLVVGGLGGAMLVAQQPAGDKPDAQPKPKPIKPVSRDKALQVPGTPRQTLPGILKIEGKALPFKTPDSPTDSAFLAQKRGSEPVTDRVINAMVSFQINRMTSPAQMGQLPEHRDEIAKIIDTARTGASRAVIKPFVLAYKKSIIEHLKPFKENSVLMRINALLVCEEIINLPVPDEPEIPNIPEVVPFVLSLLTDKKQPDGVKYVAMKVLIKAKEAKLTTAAQEQNAATAIYNDITASSAQELLIEQGVKTLGYLRVPSVGVKERQVEILVLLCKLTLDKKAPVRIRAYAAASLARIDHSKVAGFNTNLQGMGVARGILALNAAKEAGQMDVNMFKWIMYQIWEASRVMLKDSPATKELAAGISSGMELVADTPLGDFRSPEVVRWAGKIAPGKAKIADGGAEIEIPAIDNVKADAPTGN